MKKGDSLILPISKTTQNFNQIFKIMHVHTCRLEITEILIMLERETELQVFFSDTAVIHSNSPILLRFSFSLPAEDMRKPFLIPCI